MQGNASLKTLPCTLYLYRKILNRYAAYNHSIKMMKSVRLIGLEPTRLAAPDPKSGAATNYATAAGYRSR